MRAPTPQPHRSSDLSPAELWIVFVLLTVSLLDDFVLISYITDINDFLFFDLGKKAVMFIACLSMVNLRTASRQAFAVPALPWGGTGLLNPHVLLLTAGALFFDQIIYQVGGTWNWHLGELELFDVPPYRDDVIKYLDLSLGLVINSVVEELFYRAILLAALARFIPQWGLRIFLAGLLFGAVHWSQGAVWFATITVLGWMFCYLYHLTGSIIPGIIVHTVHNIIAFTP